MPTTNYNLPTISPSDIADVPRDMNALANATDAAIMNSTSNKAPINSPAFTGSPTAPNIPTNANNTQVANASFVRSVAKEFNQDTVAGNAESVYLRVGQLRTNLSGDASKFSILLDGLGDVGFSYYDSAIIHASARSGNIIDVRYLYDQQRINRAFIRFGYVVNSSTNMLEIWVKLPAYNHALRSVKLGATNAEYDLETKVTTEPSGISYVETRSFSTSLDLALKANLASPSFTGIPTAPTALDNANNQQIANTAFVNNALTLFVGNKSVLTTTNKNYIVGAINELDLEKAPLASPVFTGTPTAPTPPANDFSTRIATTAYARTEINTTVGALSQLPTNNKASIVGAISEIDSAKAPKNSPAFTGSPTAPTQVFGNNNTLIATTAFANEAVITRLGTVANLTTTDKSTPVAAINELNSTKAPKNSPVFTGTPTAPTAVTDNNSTQLATTAYVKANTGDRGQLLTTNKANMVGAINELFTSVSNGKDAIASAITSFGVEAQGSDTFAQLSQQINNIPRQANGFVNVSSDLLSFSRVYPTSAVANRRYITVSGLNFTPSVIIISGPTERYTVEFNGAHRLENRSILMYGSVDMREVVSNNVSSSYVNATGFRLPVPNDSVAGESVRWQAFA